jgi:hypothetical protein
MQRDEVPDAIDPALYEEGDTTEDELLACVRDALTKLRAL